MRIGRTWPCRHRCLGALRPVMVVVFLCRLPFSIKCYLPPPCIWAISIHYTWATRVRGRFVGWIVILRARCQDELAHISSCQAAR